MERSECPLSPYQRPSCAVTDTITPEGKLDITAVAALHGDLLARAGQDVDIDLGNVTFIGALCLQTLVCAAKDARDTGNSLRLLNIGDLLLSQMNTMGMTPETIVEGPE